VRGPSSPSTTAPPPPPPPEPEPTAGLGGGVPLDLPSAPAAAAPAAPPPVVAGGTLSPAVLKKVKAATVMIRVTTDEGRATGSGFCALGSGLVLTNAHVVGMLISDTSPKSLEVIIHSGERDERTVPGKVVAVDRTSDLAAVRLDAPAGQPEALTVASAEQLIETQ